MLYFLEAVSSIELFRTRGTTSNRYLQGQWSWVRICSPNVWAVSKENVDFSHPLFGPYLMYYAPNLSLLPPPLTLIMIVRWRFSCTVLIGNKNQIKANTELYSKVQRYQCCYINNEVYWVELRACPLDGVIKFIFCTNTIWYNLPRTIKPSLGR